eukprot:g3750.t1
MSTTISGKDSRRPKSSSTLSWVTDKLAAGAARVNGGEFQDIEIAVIKATNHDIVSPKEKHVRTLRETIATSPNKKRVMYIIHALYERLMTPNASWLVILKTLMVFHKLIKSDGEAVFKHEMVRYKEKRKLVSLLSLENFTDRTQKENWDYSAFIRVYSLYLEEKVVVFEQISFDVERDNNNSIRFTSASSNDLLTELPKIQKLLQRVLCCIPEGKTTNNELVMDCVKWTMTECFKLYRIISEGMICLSEHFFELDKIDARKGVEMYKESVNSTTQMQSFFSAIQAMTVGQQIQFPQLEAPPEDFIEKMEEYVQGATGRTITRKFPSTISRNARGGPSPAISASRGSGTHNNAKMELPRTSSKSPETVEDLQTDLLNLDVNDNIHGLQNITNNNVQIKPVNAMNNNMHYGAQNNVYADALFGAKNELYTDTFHGVQKSSIVDSFIGTQNAPIGDVPFSTQNASTGNVPFSTQNATNVDMFLGVQNSSNVDTIFELQNVTSGESGLVDGWFHPSSGVSPLTDPVSGGHIQNGSPFDDYFTGGDVLTPLPHQSTEQMTGNPFGDDGLNHVTHSRRETLPLRQHQSARNLKFTGPGVFADPFDGLTPNIHKKTSLAAPGIPMRSESHDFTKLSHQNQNFTSFF